MNKSDQAPSESMFHELHHVALVVQNLDESVRRLERLGFGPFVDYPHLAEYTDLDVPDRSAFYDLRIKVCEIGPVALQVIEAKDDKTIYGEFLRQHGEGVFHLGFRVDDIGRAEKEAKQRGLNILSRGRRADGSGFSYLDSRSDVGVTLLLRENPRDL